MILRKTTTTLLLFFLSFCFSFHVFGQRYELSGREFMDTVFVEGENCPNGFYYFYSVKGKYPKSSSTLKNEANLFLKQTGKAYQGNGYITFRSLINCQGVMSFTQLLQANEKYEPIKFDKQLIEDLYSYLKTLDKWKIGLVDNKPYNYYSLISFKIKNGKVINVTP